MFVSFSIGLISSPIVQIVNITMTYKDAGVDIDAGEELVHLISPFCKATRRLGCNAELGGFGGLFDLSAAGYGNDSGTWLTLVRFAV